MGHLYHTHICIYIMRVVTMKVKVKVKVKAKANQSIGIRNQKHAF